MLENALRFLGEEIFLRKFGECFTGNVLLWQNGDEFGGAIQIVDGRLWMVERVGCTI